MSLVIKNSGGDDRIRTCEGLLTLNGLANRRLQPLGHISVPQSGEDQFYSRDADCQGSAFRVQLLGCCFGRQAKA
jgi:hypothetical protein